MNIKLSNVTCGYGEIIVLHDVNLLFSTGKFYCVLGANGIGKTTLFKTLLNFIPRVSGNIEINGRDLSMIDNKQLAEYISYVPQARNYSYRTSVIDTVVMGQSRFIRKFQSPSEKNYEIAFSMLKRLGLEKFSDKMYSDLSGGEQQMVLIARALSQNARFIIMDEPASNLDFENQKIVLDSLSSLVKDGIGIIMSSHSPNHASYVNSDIVVIKKDKAITQGTIDEVLTKQNLKEVYGVDINIFREKISNGEKQLVSFCIV